MPVPFGRISVNDIISVILAILSVHLTYKVIDITVTFTIFAVNCIAYFYSLCFKIIASTICCL